MEEPPELKTCGIKFFPKHISFLKKINENNLSVATRMALDELIDIKENKIIEKYLAFFALGLLLVAFSVITASIIFIAIIAGFGCALIGYSTISIVIWRTRK